MAILEVKNLEVYYGVIKALKGISFEVNEGEIVALIGANGAGKTTTLHTITGLLKAAGGSIGFDGRDITKVRGDKIVGMGMAHVPRGQTRIRGSDRVRESEAGRLYEKRQDGDRRDAADDLQALSETAGA